jgi:predicted ATPase
MTVGETPELVSTLFGLWRFYFARPYFQTAQEIGETLLRLARRANDSALAVIAHYALGGTEFYIGALSAARQHLEAGLVRYTPDQRRMPVFRTGQDPGVGCRAYAARVLWLLGYPEQALTRLHEALAHELSHPFSLTFARAMAAWVSQFCCNVPAVREHAEAAVTLSTAQGFPFWAAQGTTLYGWALAMSGQGEEGLALLHQGIAAWRTTRSALFVPYFYTMLAEVSATWTTRKMLSRR